MDYGIYAGDTSKTIYFRLRDSTTGLAKTGLAFGSAGNSCYYTLPLAVDVQIPLVTLAAPTTAWASGGFIEVDAVTSKGLYRLDLSDAAIASGDYVIISIEFDGVIEESQEIPLHKRQVNLVQIDGALTNGVPAVASRPILYLQQLNLDCDIAGEGALEMNNANATGFGIHGDAPINTGARFDGTIGMSLAGSGVDLELSGTGTFIQSGGGLVQVDTAQISGDATAANNCELQFDGTGLSGGTFPSRQDQVSALSIGAAGLSFNASSVNVTTGNETNSYTDTFSAGVIHIVEDATTVTLFEYVFDLSEFSGTATNFMWTGYVQNNNTTVDVQYYDEVAAGWKTLQTLAGSNSTTLIEHDFDVPVNGTGTGANFGRTRLRFSSADTTAIGTDRVRCTFSQATFGVKNGTTITLTEATINKNFSGENWILVLNGQDISGSYFEGGHVTGVSSASTEVTFENFTFGAGSYPPGHYRRCGIGDSDGRFTGASAGEYIFDNCYSAVAGSGTPDFTFSGATGINNRAWLGGSNYTLGAACTVSHEVLAGGGQTFNTGGAIVECRGTCRSLTVDLDVAAAGTVQFVGITGPIVITDTGTATGTVNLYGVSSSVTDSTAGSVTINNLTVNQTNVDAILADTQSLVARITATLFANMTSMAQWLGLIAGKQTGNATARTEIRATGAGSGTFDETTDSQQALRDNMQPAADAALVANHLDHLFKTDYDPASKPGVPTALFNELIEDDGGVSRYTVNALENGPSGSGASAAVIAAAVWDALRASHVIVGSFGESNQTVSSTDVSVSFSFGGTGYCTRSDINDIFGTSNVTTWADLNNDSDGDVITARVARSIAWATTEINDRLRGGPYEIPLPSTVAATITDLCATLAGVWLYRSRGVDDESEIDKYKWHWDRVEKTLSEIRAGKRRLDATPSVDTGGQAPFAV